MKVGLKTSGETLKTRISRWLGSPVCFYESGVFHPLPDPEMDVVLFGDFLPAMAELISRRAPPVRVWVLCHRSRMILEDFFPSLKGFIGVIPRNGIFPPTSPARNFPAPAEDWEMIFAGRLNPTKKITLLIHLVHCLQKDHGEHVRLRLIGSVEETPELAPWDEPSRKISEESIRKTIAELSWDHPPEIIPAENPEEWTQHVSPSSVMVSLSCGWAEDFGVSLAEGRELGCPLLVSDVGGHGDLAGEGILRIPAHLLWGEGFSRLLPEDMEAQARGRALARWVHERKNSPKNDEPEAIALVWDPVLGEKELSTVEGSGVSLSRAFKLNAGRFWEEASHQAFWKRYFRNWAPSEAPRTLLVLSHWAMSWPSLRIALSSVLEHWLSEQTAHSSLALLNVDTPQLPKLLSPHVKDVIFYGFSSREHYLAGFIRDFLPKCRFLIYALDLPSHLFFPGKLPPLEDVLDHRDELLLNSREDQMLLRLTYPNAPSRKVNYFIPSVDTVSWGKRPGNLKLFYAGRISPQKGLHFTLLAMHLLGESSPPLEIVGDFDEVGVRHLGVDSGDYREFLNALIHELKLSPKVTFLPSLPHQEVLRKLGEEKSLVVCPSVHVDENFGLLSRDALSRGCPVVQTSWGGLRKFQELFPDAVRSTPVHVTSRALQVNPFDLARKIFDASSMKRIKNRTPLPHLEEIGSNNLVGHFHPAPGMEELRRQPLPGHQVLDSERHPELIQKTREIYGAVPLRPGGNLLTPWLKIHETAIEVFDPLQERVKILRRGSPSIKIEMFTRCSVWISPEEYQDLWELSQIYREDPE